MSAWLTPLSQFHFLRPWWLLALLCVPALWWWRSHTRQRNVWRDAVDAHLLPHLLDTNHGATKRNWQNRSHP